MTTNGQQYDVVIVGAGPIGLACGIAAKRRDLTHLIIDKGALVNSFVGYPTDLEFFSTPELFEIGGHPFPCLHYKPRRAEALEYYRRVAETEALNVRLYEAVEALEGTQGAFVVRTAKAHYGARNVVVATGFFDVPNRLGVPGEALPHVMHYYKEPYPYVGQRVTIIGAKNSAAKAALDCYRHGADVTMLVRGPAFTKSVKYWIRPDLENRIAEGAIKAHFSTEVTEITEDAVHYTDPDGRHVLPTDWVLALTGYRPDFPFLQALGIALANDAFRTPVHDPTTMQTNRNGVYLAGVVCGGLKTSVWFIENSRAHADVIMHHIATGEPSTPVNPKGNFKTAE